ncbi:hypothetical protein HY256_12080 [Candidatus Sumerlaeota bacterium]|nr:hypothetical protein [Candidatus Sumerlaeota bacterium]
MSSKKVTIKTNQLYNDNENYVVLEIEVPEGADGTTREIASASVRAFDMETKSKRSVDASASVTFSNKPDVVEESTNKSVMVPAVTLVAVEENRLATQLRDEGKVEEARERLLRNSEYLARKNDSLKDEGLDQLSELNKSNAANLSPAEYQKEKKIMRESQSLEMRQAYKLKK